MEIELRLISDCSAVPCCDALLPVHSDMPPRAKGNRGRRRGGGRRAFAKSRGAVTATAFDALSEAPTSSTSDVTIGSDNVLKWTTLKETHGYSDDTEFATFLLGLADQLDSTKMPNTTSSKEKPGSNDDDEDKDRSGDGDNTHDDHNEEGNDQSKADDKDKAGSDDTLVGEKAETTGDSKAPCDDDQADEFNESPSEDEKDIDWTPGSFRRETRCTRQSVRVATLMSRKSMRQTRSRKIKSLPSFRKPKLKKRSSHVGEVLRVSPISIMVTPLVSHVASSTKKLADRIRQCIDCSQKHALGECPLTDPVLVVMDTISQKDDLRRPFASLTLPKILKLMNIDKRHGPSVVAVEHIAQYTQFGPLVGERIEEADIHEDMDLKHIWEVFGNDFKLYIDTANENTSNWLRYIRPANSRSERNTSVTVKQDNLYFVTTEDVEAGTELVYWSDDPTSFWSKKKLEKTSCGGCNQRFCHPIYYRMHCMIFHDPNFSLTIRKYHCKICGIAILGKENIMRHASEMHDGKGAYQCQYCKKFFLRLNYLDMHRTYGCKLNPRRSRPLCDLCGKKFCQPQKLKVHIRRMHSDIDEVLKEFQCKSCLKLLGSRAALQRHLKEVHNKDQNIAATCDRCGKTFQNKSNLKIHMLTHSGVKPFRCIENGCMAAFTTKQCLQFHYKKVHGYSLDTMPSIERCIAYTFESYSGGTSDGEAMPEFREGVSLTLDDPKSMTSIVTISNTDLNSSSMCSSSMAEFPSSVAKNDDHSATGLITDFGEQRPASLAIERTWLDEGRDNIDHINVVSSPIPAISPQLASSDMSPTESRSVMRTSSSFVSPHEDHAADADLEAEEVMIMKTANENSPELIMNHKPDFNESPIKSEQLQHQQQQQQREMGSVDVAPPLDDIVDEEDDDDVERMDDSSDVDLETDIDENSVSDHSLDHLNPEDVDDGDSSDAMGFSPLRTRSALHQQDDMLCDVDRMHARNMAMYNVSSAPSLLRLSDKHPDGGGGLKDFASDVVSACDFSVVRQYAAASRALHTDYSLQMSRHCNTGLDGGNELHPQDSHEEINIGQHSAAEDLRGQLSRYEQQLSRGVDMDSPHVKTEDDDEIMVTVGKCGCPRMDHVDGDLLVSPDDDEDDDNDMDDDESDDRPRQQQQQQQQQRDDVEAALALAHQDHQQHNETFSKDNDYAHHTPPPPPPPPPLPPSHPHLSRDLDRLSMHSLDLSIPRSTVHLLEHFSRSNPHVLEHLASRAAAAGGSPMSPSSLSPPDNQSSSGHGANLHMGQLGVQFHGMVDSLPRPLPHRMDHVIGHHHHLQSSHAALDHMSSRHDDVMIESHNMMDPMSPPLKSHATPLESHVNQSAHPYVVDHLTRYATSQHHAMDHGFPRGGTSSSSSALMDPLHRVGMETATLARPSPRSGRSFTAYGVEHSVATGQGLSSSYLLQSERLSRSPSAAYGLEHRATPHSLDLTTSRGGGGGGTTNNGNGSLDSPPQSHDTGGRLGGDISPPSSYGQGNSPPILSSSSSSSTSSYQDPSKLPTFEARSSSVANSQLPLSSSSPALPSASSIHSTYPTYLEYY